MTDEPIPLIVRLMAREVVSPEEDPRVPAIGRVLAGSAATTAADLDMATEDLGALTAAIHRARAAAREVRAQVDAALHGLFPPDVMQRSGEALATATRPVREATIQVMELEAVEGVISAQIAKLRRGLDRRQTGNDSPPTDQE